MEKPEIKLNPEFTNQGKEARRGRDLAEVRKKFIKETEEGMGSDSTPSLEELAAEKESKKAND